MNRIMRIVFVAGFTAIITAVPLFAGQADISGDYWYGWLGANATTGVPGSDSGTMSASDTTWTIQYTDDGGGSYTETMQIDDKRVIRGGWLEVDATQDGQSGTLTMASTGNVLVDVTRTPDADGDYGFGLYHKKATGMQSSDIAGHYACFDHWLDVSSRGTSTGFGTASFDSDGSWSYISPGGSGTGSWSINGNATASLSIAGEETVELGIGPGGLMTFFDTDPLESDDLGHSILLKKGTGRTASEALGIYLLQGLYTDNGENPLTEWGQVSLQDDSYWLMACQNSDGESYTKSGTWNIEGDGYLQMTEFTTGSLLYEGYLSLDAGLIVAARMGDYTGTAMMVQVPEPCTLCLLALGGIALLHRKHGIQ